MKTHVSHTLLNAVQRLAAAPEHALAKLTARLSTSPAPVIAPSPTPDHVLTRLESMFEALNDLASQPDNRAAFELVCDALQSELPTETMAAGLYHIDADEIRIVTARGAERDLLRGTTMSPKRCFAGRTHEAAIVMHGGDGGADWIGAGDEDSSILLCPILHDTHLLGVIALADPLCEARFDEHDVELMSYVSGQLADFIQVGRLRPSIPVRAPL